MSSESRDEILANFQTVTGIEDFEKAIRLLDKNDWDFRKAVSEATPSSNNDMTSVINSSQKLDALPKFRNNSLNEYWSGGKVKLPEHDDRASGDASYSQQFLSSSPPVSPSNACSKQVNYKRRHDGLPVSYNFDSLEASTSNSLFFKVKLIVAYDVQQFTLDVSNDITVGKIKQMIQERSSIPISSQILSGWIKEPQSDEAKLEDLIKLSSSDFSYYLILHRKESCDRETMKRYILKICDQLKGKYYTVEMPGSHKILQVKKDVAKLSEIPVSKQLWDGWPPSVNDDTLLINAGLSEPVHHLNLSIRLELEVIDLVSSSSSHEEFEDSPEVFCADDEQVFSTENSQVNLRPLVPQDVEDEIAGSVHFIDTFIYRYGTNCPQFFSGTLLQALREACLRPMAERKLLAVYLHHDDSVLSNIFCSEVLCFDSIVETLSANFILWGWDVTSDTARSMFYNSITELVGSSIVETISKFTVDNYPLLIILTRPRRNVDLFNVITGNNSVNELLSLLIHAVDIFSEIQNTEVKNEEERSLRENIKDEQDRAYEESLLADRAKDEAKRLQETLQREERERIKKQRQEEEESREAERLAVQSQLPPEPPENCTDSVVKARIRTPSGEVIQRHFFASDSLKTLFNYLLVQGFRIAEYKVISGWPRKDLTTLDHMISMKELKLANQETFILEQR